jgi:FkbM family methyltransferase
MIYTLIQDKVFFDVGANNGFTSVPVAQNNSNVKVYAFEPTPDEVNIFFKRRS